MAFFSINRDFDC